MLEIFFFADKMRLRERDMSYDLMFQNALKLHQSGNFAEAEQLYRQILEAVPEQPDVLNLLGMIAQEKNAHNQAVELFYRASKQRPDNPFYHFNQGFSLLQTKKLSEAEFEFSKALELQPDMKEAVYFSGLTAEQKGETQKAADLYERALALNPQYVEPKLALCLLNGGLDELNLLDEQICDNYMIKYNIAKKYFDAENFDKALLYADKAAKLAPENEDISLLLGLIYLQQKSVSDAENMFEKTLEINPENLPALINLANISAEANDAETAEKLYRRALDINPKDFDAHLNLANMLYNCNRKAEAMDEYRAAVLVEPENPAVLRNLGIVLKEQNEYEEALGLFFSALNKIPNDKQLAINIAETITLLAKNDKDTALKIAKNWLKYTPENPVAKHTSAALNGKNIDDNHEYSEILFDAFADNYDDVLQRIDYRLADKIAEIIQNIDGKIADLGCGSGLVGAALKANDKRTLIGVDISSEMLKKAEKTGKYDKLIKSDIIEFLRQKPEADLLVAADVLCYIGDLEPFLAAAEKYKMCFSVEDLPDRDGYVMQPSGRYAHSQKYIENLLKKHNITNFSSFTTLIRKEDEKDIIGRIFCIGF